MNYETLVILGIVHLPGVTHMLMPSYPAPMPTWSTPATSRIWLMCAATRNTAHQLTQYKVEQS